MQYCLVDMMHDYGIIRAMTIRRRFACLLVGLALAMALLAGHSVTASAALPDTLDTTGYGPYDSPLIQPSRSNWTVTLDYIPLNGSASLSFLAQDKTFLDYKLVATDIPGEIIYQGLGTAPIYVNAYSGSYHISLSY